MDISTLYVGQGALAVARHGSEAIIVDSFVPGSSEPDRQRILRNLELLLHNHRLTGLVLTGFDCDHSCEDGVDLILSKFQPEWIMYPKYYKDTDAAKSVFNVLNRQEQRRKGSPRSLKKISVRLDRLDSRLLTGLSSSFTFELFSPHMDDMDCSNNCSIVLKLTGIGQTGFSYLITGDTENGRWEQINKIFGVALRSHVVAAPHHGSKNATNARTIILTDPNTVLISAGVENQYGHPDPQAVGAYSTVAKHVYATNVEGGVSLFTKVIGSDFATTLFR